MQLNLHIWLIQFWDYPLVVAKNPKGKNVFNNQSFLGWWSFPLFSWLPWTIQQYESKEKLDTGHPQGLKH